MKSNNDVVFNADCACIIGRFQVDNLHEGHIDLITKIVDSHSKTIIFLGLSPIKCSRNNPLDFEARKQMILAQFPDVIVLYIPDTYSDIDWSNSLDTQIKHITGVNQTVALYGSRDSFIKYYSGKYPCVEIEQEIFISGTDIRKRVSNDVKASENFRKGVIWATMNQYPSCHPTVDAAIIREDKILLGKRNSEPNYRFPGGFVNPKETFEDAVVREATEETSLEFSNANPVFIKSFVVNDWRYRNEANKITTSLFVLDSFRGTPKPNDDIDELRFFPLTEELINEVVDEHKPLIQCIIDRYNGKP